MCRFKIAFLNSLLSVVKFQYILCVGSRKSKESADIGTFVSIHPMCRFKIKAKAQQSLTSKFQYILCVGSRIVLVALKEECNMFQYILCVGSS